MSRPSWDQYCLEIARTVATRSTCDRKHVGAVLVRDKRIVATGYNGAPPGAHHCDDVGHLLGPDGGCHRTVHAERNAVASTPSRAALQGASAFLTCSPCEACLRYLVDHGVTRIVFAELYRKSEHLASAQVLGIDLVHMPLEVRTR